MYDELNDVKLDVSEYGEEPLTEIERDAWERRVKSNLNVRRANKKTAKRRRAKWLIPTAAVLLLLIGATLPAGQQALARLPFVAGLIERFAGEAGENVDYSPYKTQVGETAVNEFGKLTLKEMIVDTDRLMIGLMLEPADGASVNDQLALEPKIVINGRKDLWTGGYLARREAESGGYMIYQEFWLRELPAGERLRVTLTYDQIFGKGWEGELNQLAKPWVFDVDSSRSALLAETETIRIDREVELSSGERIVIEKAVTSPLSTRIIFRMTQEADAGAQNQLFGFRLIGEDGQEVDSTSSSGGVGEYSYATYPKVDFRSQMYTLIPYDGSKDAELSEGIPIEP